MVIKAVMFDLDGTLLDRASSLVQFIELQYQKYPVLQRSSLADYLQSFVALDKNGYVWKDLVYQQLIDAYGFQGISWEILLENFAIAAIGYLPACEAADAMCRDVSELPDIIHRL